MGFCLHEINPRQAQDGQSVVVSGNLYHTTVPLSVCIVLMESAPWTHPPGRLVGEGENLAMRNLTCKAMAMRSSAP